MYKVIASMFTGLALSACGGGGSSGSAVGSLAELNAAASQSGSTASKALQNYSSGDSVVAMQGVLKTKNSSGKELYVFALTKDKQTIINTFTDAFTLTTSNYTDFGGSNFYRYNGAGTNADGVYNDCFTPVFNSYINPIRSKPDTEPFTMTTITFP